MQLVEIIKNNPITMFHKFCKVKKIVRKKDDNNFDLIRKLKESDESNLIELENFLELIDGSKTTSFKIFKTKKVIPVNTDIKKLSVTKQNTNEQGVVKCNEAKINNGLLETKYSVFKRYKAIGYNQTTPEFDNYKISCKLGSDLFRVEGNLSYIDQVSILFQNSINQIDSPNILFDDEKFEQIKDKIEESDKTSNLKITKIDNKLTRGNVVDTLGLKSKAKKDLQDFVKGNNTYDDDFLGELSVLIADNPSELIIDSQKYCFEYEIFPEVKIDIVLSINRKGVFHLNTVPRGLYEFITEIASEL